MAHAPFITEVQCREAIGRPAKLPALAVAHNECRRLWLMAVTVEVHHTGDAGSRRDVIARIEHVFYDRPGDWRVVILGSQATDRWEMKITGPHAFERSYTLEGAMGQHDPGAVAAIVARMLPSRSE